MTDADDILRFWIEEVGPKGWYRQDAALDAHIRERFFDDWEAAHQGACGRMLTHAKGALACLILLDQFPRNMFRDDARAFASDDAARGIAKKAIDLGWDMQIAEPQRQFFYLPLMHSEALPDQDRCVRLVITRMPETGAVTLRHAQAHREIIRHFGRFPTRNAALGRRTSREETRFLEEGGYGAALRKFPEPA